MLRASEQPLQNAYDLAIVDLDGVVYVGRHAVAHAVASLERARAAGLRPVFVTNNAARTPAEVAEHLRGIGLRAGAEDVVTSAQAASAVLREELAADAPVFVIGGAGLEDALRERGLRPVTTPEEEPAAVVSGYAPDLRWSRVVHGSILVGRGLPWVATNTDATIPTEHGLGPGNGVLVDVVARFTGREPVVAGKPERPVFTETTRRFEGKHPLVLGDRLDTDIAGGRGAGMATALVMTGVTGLQELTAATARQRPDFLVADLRGLAEPQPALAAGADAGVTCGGWTAGVEDGSLVVEGAGDTASWWRAAAVAGWAHRDATGEPADTRRVRPPG